MGKRDRERERESEVEEKGETGRGDACLYVATDG